MPSTLIVPFVAPSAISAACNALSEAVFNSAIAPVTVVAVVPMAALPNNVSALSAFVPCAAVAYAVDSVYAAEPNPCTATSVPSTLIVPFVAPSAISAACNALSEAVFNSLIAPTKEPFSVVVKLVKLPSAAVAR